VQPLSDEVILVLTTTAEKSDAQRLAQILIEARLAACTQISGPLESSYRWNSRIETAREWQLSVKTLRSKYEDVERAILESHPYDQPELIVVPTVIVSAGYYQWLVSQIVGKSTTPPPSTVS
jgi:periplasmic divalent cation tolerance protein